MGSLIFIHLWELSPMTDLIVLIGYMAYDKSGCLSHNENVPLAVEIEMFLTGETWKI